MYLPDDEEDWEPLGNRGAADAIRGLNSHLRKIPRVVNDFLYSASVLQHLKQWRYRYAGKLSPGQLSIAELQLQVEKIDCRSLTFYGDGWYVYRFACAIGHIEELAGYERLAHLFAVCGPSESNSQKQQNLLIEPGNWTLLDWKSSPIHQLNEKLNLDFSRLSREQLRDYLIFFCSFLGAEDEEEDTIAPFLIPGNVEDFRWDDALLRLEEIAPERRLKIFFPPQDINRADDFDLGRSNKDSKTSATTGQTNSGTVSKAEIRSQVKAEFDKLDGKKNPPDPKLKTGTPLTEPQEQDTSSQDANRITGRFNDVLVWYKDGLFRAVFSVTTGGQVAMDEDELAVNIDRLLPRWVVRYGPYPVPLLCREKKREKIFAQNLLERIKQHTSSRSNAKPPIRLRGLRVYGEEFRLSGTFPETVQLVDIEFFGNVILDDAVFEHSLILHNCRLLRGLSAENATIKGAFHLNGSYLHGAIEKKPNPIKKKPNLKTGLNLDSTLSHPVINLNGLKVKRGLFADRVTAFGRIRARGAQITGPMMTRGLQIHSRANVNNDDPILDFSNMRIDGPLDLGGYFPKTQQLEIARRTVIEGTAMMQNLQAFRANLSGIRIDGYLDLEACRIAGTLAMNVTERTTDPKSYWRTHIKNSFNADQARVGLINISGSRIEGWLSLAHLQLGGSLFARLDGRFRTRIGSDLTVSGAAICGDIDLAGMEIGRNLLFITGNCGRLNICAEAWVKPPEQQQDATPGIVLATANGVFLQDVTIRAGMNLTGIHLEKPDGTLYTGNFTSLGTRLGGGVRFWREDARTRFKEAFKELKPSLASEDMDGAIDQIRAFIPGNLDLRGIQTADSIDLGRCNIGGNIRLENARIGGSLRACIKGESEACSTTTDLQADNARIEGNVDLSGLIVRNNLIARDLQVNGNLLLASDDPKDQCAQVSGTIDLEGTQAAARLVLSSKNLKMKNNESNDARIKLARCRVGQLAIRFENTFPHTLNLLAIEVRDWHLEKHEQVLALLEKTQPFYAGNYIDVEHRLDRIGNKELADKIYCKMKERQMKKHRSDCSGFWDRLCHILGRLRYCASNLFSRHGTNPWLMATWLIITMIPVFIVLSNPKNVEFVLTSDNELPTDLEQHWGPLKAAGLAASYAIPFYGGARSEVVRARLNGGICLCLHPILSETFSMFAPPAATPAPETKAESESCDYSDYSDYIVTMISPYEFAMLMSALQFILWIFIAANLPTIIRRRS